MSQGQTSYYKWQIPDENEDPYFDKIVQLYSDIDDSVFGLQNTIGNAVIPPEGLKWSALTSTLSWTGEWRVPLIRGFSFTVPFAPNGVDKSVILADGDRLVVNVPRTAGGNIVGSMTQVSTASFQVAAGTLILGRRINGAFVSSTISRDLELCAASVTTVERDAVAPKAGRIVLNTDTGQFQGYNGSTWVVLG